jgi:thiamine biosynthesis lipoprotein
LDLLKEPGGPVLYKRRFPLMGGSAVIEFVDDRGQERAEQVARAVEAEACRIERKFSRYRETSVVSEINRNAGRMPVAVDEETEMLVQAALDLARMTDGRFDPTVGVLRRAWDFKAGKVPSAEEIGSLLPLVNADAVTVRNATVFLRNAGMEIDLGGVGKEYAVDRAARLMKDAGVRSAIVNFAGDVRTIGSRGDGQPWKVGVLDPRDRGRCRFAVRTLGDAGIATSGDYERGFVKDGVRYHHILDARTGWPARGLASVTVVAGSAFRAGRFATAAFLLGAEAGLALLESAPGVEGTLITEAGSIVSTIGMALLSDLPGSVWAALQLF